MRRNPRRALATILALLGCTLTPGLAARAGESAAASSPLAPPVPAGEPVEMGNGLVLVRVSPMSDGIHQEFLARRGGEWVAVARSLRPPAPFPDDGVAIYDSSIDPRHRLIAREPRASGMPSEIARSRAGS